MKPLELGLAGRLARAFIDSRLTPLLILVSILLGAGATLILPREEEPQITVPVADVFVSMPGASAEEVEQRVTYPIEKLVRELPGVEYVYSTSSPGRSLVIVRFYVGVDPENALVRLYNKLYSNFDRIPPGVSQPLIKSRSIDDVPILGLTLSSPSLSGFELRQLAAQLEEQLKQVPDVSETRLLGGLRRQVRVELDPARLAAYDLEPGQVVQALQADNAASQSGHLDTENRALLVRSGGFFRDAGELAGTVVAVRAGRPVYLRDVATLADGPEDPAEYVFFTDRKTPQDQNAVTLSLAKRRGANAITVAHAVLQRVEALKKGDYLPAGVTLTVTRNYGETAAERSNELLVHMGVAVVSVTALIWLALGRRESLVVAVAIPVTLALTLATFVLYHFTLNRVTFFALIFSIGILVDDAIVVVENVVRHLRLPENRGRSRRDVVLAAVAEVGNPTILATLTVVAAILPMAFVSGLMGPYMLPIPLGASAAMLFSMIVAFTVVPWAALRLLGKGEPHHEGEEDRLTVLYRRVMGWLLHHRVARATFVAGTLLLLAGALGLVGLRAVVFKMLPFDNKSEFQVLLDMPEGSSLEQTAALAAAVGRELRSVPEVVDYQTYVGTSAPYNFNGLVRHYFLRSGPNVADLQVNLLPKGERSRQSHEIAKSVRPRLQQVVSGVPGATLQVTEIPPGPPVLQTLVTEVYGPRPEGRLALARRIRELYGKTEGVVDVDWYVEEAQPEVRLEVDRPKAARSGLSTRQIVDALDTALGGRVAGLLHDPSWREDVPIQVRFRPGDRTSLGLLESLKLKGVPLATLVRARRETADTSIYHKNMLPVVYVIGDVSGKTDSPLYSILDLSLAMAKLPDPPAMYFFRQPPGTEHYAVKWDGEWHVTYEVFRDMGIAFAVVVVLIYALIVGWFQNFATPLVILSAIPFSLVGIMPAHWLLGAFFTATSMIGFIAGAGIVVRNSIILVDFIELRLKEGMPLDLAVIDAGAVRFRPMLLTAAAVVVAVILADPIFNGLAISLMAGEVASLLLSRTAVPVLYFMLWRKHHGQ